MCWCLECPEGWTRFEGSCHTLFTRPTSLTWLAAQAECHRSGADLVSIKDADEMTFIHYMLTTEWRTQDVRTFIGKYVVTA